MSWNGEMYFPSAFSVNQIKHWVNMFGGYWLSVLQQVYCVVMFSGLQRECSLSLLAEGVSIFDFCWKTCEETVRFSCLLAMITYVYVQLQRAFHPTGCVLSLSMGLLTRYTQRGRCPTSCRLLLSNDRWRVKAPCELSPSDKIPSTQV